MKVKPEFIGATVQHPRLGTLIKIEADQGEYYAKIGLTKIVENDTENKPKRSNKRRRNGDGATD